MGDNEEWIEKKIRHGWILVAGGCLLAVAGVLFGWTPGDLPFNPRIITGLGILLLAPGLAHLVKYRLARGDRKRIRRLSAEERDERLTFIRDRAGYRAYWASATLAYTVLMWLSFAESGSLPPISTDVMWYVMAGVVIVPLAVYIGSYASDDAHL
jgi:ABC-type uncharacterized transport system permease subunit